MGGSQTGAAGAGHTHGPGEAHDHEGHAHDEHGFLDTVRAIGTEQVRRRRRGWLLGGLFALVGATVLAECSARSLAVPPSWGAADFPAPVGLLGPHPDPLLSYSIVPETSLTVGLHERAFGPLGVSGWPPPGAPGDPLVLLLGGSGVLGFERPPEDAPASRLARRLAAPGQPWRGLALGAPGWTAGQAVQAFGLAADALGPDLVVLDLTEDMVVERSPCIDGHGLAHRDFLPLPAALRRFLWRHSALYGRLARGYAAEVLDVPDPALDPRPPSAFARPENQAAALQAVDALAQLCRARGTPFLVVFRTEVEGPEGAARQETMGARLAELAIPAETTSSALPSAEFLEAALSRAGLGR